MATLVLSSVGGAVAGPMGAAVGSFFGRQIDRQSRQPGAARKLSDLRIQSAQYGAEIPAIFGRMRAAGTVVWASDLVETARVSKSGAQRSYSVSFAIALSSRPLEEIGRIWADGRLIRGAAGDHKIPFSMRLLSGDEDQLADPLIASREGISSTPAYRGLGLLVLEDFDLSTFGNRIPQITAEVDAGDTDMDAMALAAEILQLPAAPRAEQPMIGGFALQGDRKADCLAPLTDTFRIPFAFGPDGWVASREPVHHVLASTDELLIDRTQDMASEVAVPTTVSIRYFDASMDFAAGEKAARLPGEQRIRRIEFPGVLSSDEAISLAHHQLAAAWHGRRQTRVSMPLARCHGIRLGDAITVAGVVGEPLRVIGIDLKEGRADLLLRPALKVSTSILSEAGAVKRELDLRPEQLKLALVELPEAGSTGTQKLAVAMAGGPQPWRRLGLEIKIAGSVQDLQSADLPAVFGKLLQPLNAAPEAAFDERNHLEVQLDHDEWLVGVEDPELLAGANPARVGDEWLQFGTAEALGKGHYRLGRLVRRKYGTATTDRHEPGTDFLLIAPGRLAELQVPLEMLGSPMSATAYAPDGSAMTTQHVLKGQAALPLAPVHMFSRWSGQRSRSAGHAEADRCGMAGPCRHHAWRSK